MTTSLLVSSVKTQEYVDCACFGSSAVACSVIAIQIEIIWLHKKNSQIGKFKNKSSKWFGFVYAYCTIPRIAKKDIQTSCCFAFFITSAKLVSQTGQKNFKVFVHFLTFLSVLLTIIGLIGYCGLRWIRIINYQENLALCLVGFFNTFIYGASRLCMYALFARVSNNSPIFFFIVPTVGTVHVI